MSGGEVLAGTWRLAGREEEFRRHSTGRLIGNRIVWLARCGSTNDVARALAEAGEPEGTIVATDEQTAGRGRKGDPWHSPAGQGLWCSMVLYPRMEANLAPQLTLELASALQACLEARLGLRCELKEPNDLLLGGRKLAGILAESATTGNSSRLEFLALGIGVNVSTEFPDALRQTATSLAGHVPAEQLPSLPRLLAWLAAEFESRYMTLDRRNLPD